MDRIWCVFVANELTPSFTGLNFERASRVRDAILRMGGEAVIEPDESSWLDDEQVDLTPVSASA